jgi:hypothetical protein
MPTAVSWIMADHATGADPCDSHCKALASTLESMEMLGIIDELR